MSHNKDGGKTNYYNIKANKKGLVDLDRIAEQLDLHPFEFNIMKAIWGMAIARKTGETRHSGTSILRDNNKQKAYSKKLYKMTKSNLKCLKL